MERGLFGTTEAVTGWEELCRVALSSAHRCLEALRTDLTSGGRVRYLVSPETSTVVLAYASTRHPKDTE
ncbi:hypothetical protein [Streptomyces sp. NPDC059979]|uniref:hypothetical protein n=1 Tax=Streptomyces sp. NPDC059979 TaxID=3347021 RepID=UPI0036C1507F